MAFGDFARGFVEQRNIRAQEDLQERELGLRETQNKITQQQDLFSRAQGVVENTVQLHSNLLEQGLTREQAQEALGPTLQMAAAAIGGFSEVDPAGGAALKAQLQAGLNQATPTESATTEGAATGAGKVAETRAILGQDPTQEQRERAAGVATEPTEIEKLQDALAVARNEGNTERQAQLLGRIAKLSGKSDNANNALFEGGEIKNSVVNTIFRMAAAQFNGIYDPTTGEFAGLSEGDGQKVLQISTDAIDEIISGRTSNTGKAVQIAAFRHGVRFELPTGNEREQLMEFAVDAIEAGRDEEEVIRLIEGFGITEEEFLQFQEERGI